MSLNSRKEPGGGRISGIAGPSQHRTSRNNREFSFCFAFSFSLTSRMHIHCYNCGFSRPARKPSSRFCSDGFPIARIVAWFHLVLVHFLIPLVPKQRKQQQLWREVQKKALFTFPKPICRPGAAKLNRRSDLGSISFGDGLAGDSACMNGN